MGDSYASGEGAGVYTPETNTADNMCHRSPLSWQVNLTLPGIGPVSDPTKVDLEQVACSGAKTANITTQPQGSAPSEPPQIAALTGSERAVLLSIGGNDLGFGPTLQTCIMATCLSPAEVTDMKLKLRSTVIPAVNGVMEAIWAKAPNARIVLVGYPRLMEMNANAVGCYGITQAEADAFDDVAEAFRRQSVAMIMKQRLAGNNKSIYIDTMDKFAGHGACTGPSTQWITSLVQLTSPDPEAFHPNQTGYAKITETVNDQLASPRMVCANRWCIQRFADETVASNGKITLAVKGSIRSKYDTEGGATGWLGAPAGEETCATGNTECSQKFQNGSIHYKPSTGKSWTLRG